MALNPVTVKFFALSASKRKSVLLGLCDRALAVWEDGFPPGGEITYEEKVAGSIQTIQVSLLREALDSIRHCTGNDDVWERFTEPIIALRDEDLKLTDSEEYAFYAIYNAFRLFINGDNVEETLILNQALSALQWEKVLEVFASEVDNAA